MHAGLTKPERVMCFDREIEDLLSHKDWKMFHMFTNTEDAEEMRELLAKMKQLIFKTVPHLKRHCETVRSVLTAGR